MPEQRRLIRSSAFQIIAALSIISPANGQDFGGGGFVGGGSSDGGFVGGGSSDGGFVGGGSSDGGLIDGAWGDIGLNDNGLNSSSADSTWVEGNEEVILLQVNPFVYDWNPLRSEDPFDPYDTNDLDNPFRDGLNQHCGPAAACGGEPPEPIPFPIIPPIDNTGVILEPPRFRLGLAEEGDEASKEDLAFPRAVGLEYANNRILCSGVIVSESYVLTAAHCACGEPPIFAVIGTSAIPGTPNVGFTRRVEISFDNPIFYKENFCEVYKDNPIEAMQGGDAAILKFSSKLEGDVYQALLPADIVSTSDFNYSTVRAVGWGESDNNWKSGQKNYTVLQITSRLCTDSDEVFYGCGSGLEAIASNPPNDTCFADSGGPLYVIDTGGEQRLMAITSRSLQVREGDLCGSGGIYTSLESDAIREWLFTEIE